MFARSQLRDPEFAKYRESATWLTAGADSRTPISYAPVAPASLEFLAEFLPEVLAQLPEFGGPIASSRLAAPSVAF